MSAGPHFSILTPVHQPDLGHFRACLDSVVAQTFDDWELIVVFDGRHADRYQAAVDAFADPRIRTVLRDDNGGISTATNDGLAVATGEFIALVDHDDVLAPFALEASAEAIARWSDVDVVYSDEDKLDNDERVDPYFKPQFSPERLRVHMYLGHLGIYRRSLVEEIGGFRSEFDGAQDHDLALRATERARRVVHIPRVLYHWRRSDASTAESAGAKSWAYDADVRAVDAALQRQGMQARATPRRGSTGIVDLVPALRTSPSVSIIIPTAGGSRLMTGERFRLIDRCLTSIDAASTYDNYEVVTVVDSSAPATLEAELAEIGPPNSRFVRNDRPFNFSEACNLGRDHSTGDVLVFLNDDTEIVTGDWLERLVMYAVLDGVGAVGAKLLYHDGRIQHIGLTCRAGGIGHHAAGRPGGTIGPFGSYTMPTNVIAVTGACLAIAADRFDEVGGFSRAFPVNFNDVDLCFKLYRAGYRNVIDPQITLVHHESSSREHVTTETEERVLRDRWSFLLTDDPYDNPHLRTDHTPGGNMEPQLPPMYFVELRELCGLDRFDPRPWPPERLYAE